MYEIWGFPGSSDGREFTCNMGETMIQSLAWEDPLEKGTAATAIFLPGEFYGQRNLAVRLPNNKKFKY